MPVRMIREGILTSRKVCALTFGAEVFYRRLMSIADDFGRYQADTLELLSKLYAMHMVAEDTPEKPRPADIERWLLECVKVGLIVVYEVAGRRYLEIASFGQQLRAKKSKFPEPPANAGECEQREEPAKQLLANASNGKQMQETAHLGGGGSGVGDDISALTVRNAPEVREPVDKACGQPPLAEVWQELAGVPPNAPTADVLAKLLQEGCAVAHLRVAWEVARERKPSPQRIPVAYVAPIVREAMAGKLAVQRAARGEKPAQTHAWMHDDEALLAKARDAGVHARPGETYEDLRRRVGQALEVRAVDKLSTGAR